MGYVLCSTSYFKIQIVNVNLTEMKKVQVLWVSITGILSLSAEDIWST